MGNPLFTIMMFVVLLAAWWFMSRSTKKQQQERQNTLNAMKPGDEVVTIGGLHGVLAEINETDKTVTLDCEGVYLVFERSAIRTVKPGVVASNDDAVTTEDLQPPTTESSDVATPTDDEETKA